MWPVEIKEHENKRLLLPLDPDIFIKRIILVKSLYILAENRDECWKPIYRLSALARAGRSDPQRRQGRPFLNSHNINALSSGLEWDERSTNKLSFNPPFVLMTNRKSWDTAFTSSSCISKTLLENWTSLFVIAFLIKNQMSFLRTKNLLTDKPLIELANGKKPNWKYSFCWLKSRWCRISVGCWKIRMDMVLSFKKTSKLHAPYLVIFFHLCSVVVL